MSKYKSLWEYIANRETFPLELSFEHIEEILGFPIDHSFLSYKKELNEYGYTVEKISMKNQSVIFNKK